MSHPFPAPDEAERAPERLAAGRAKGGLRGVGGVEGVGLGRHGAVAPEDAEGDEEVGARPRRLADVGAVEVRKGLLEDGLEELEALRRVGARVRRENEGLAEVLRADVAEEALADDARRGVTERVEAWQRRG